MKKRHVFFAPPLTVLLLMAGVRLPCFFRFTLTARRLAAEQEGPTVKAVPSTDRPFFAPPRPEDAPSLTPEQALDVAAYVNGQPRHQMESAQLDEIRRVIPLPEIE